MSAIAAEHPLATSSIPLRTRKRRPFESWSWTKSTDQRAFGCARSGSRPRSYPALPALALAHHQAFLVLKALAPLSVHPMALGAQEEMQAAIAEPALLGRAPSDEVGEPRLEVGGTINERSCDRP